MTSMPIHTAAAVWRLLKDVLVDRCASHSGFWAPWAVAAGPSSRSSTPSKGIGAAAASSPLGHASPLQGSPRGGGAEESSPGRGGKKSASGAVVPSSSWSLEFDVLADFLGTSVADLSTFLSRQQAAVVGGGDVGVEGVVEDEQRVVLAAASEYVLSRVPSWLQDATAMNGGHESNSTEVSAAAVNTWIGYCTRALAATLVPEMKEEDVRVLHVVAFIAVQVLSHYARSTQSRQFGMPTSNGGRGGRLDGPSITAFLLVVERCMQVLGLRLDQRKGATLGAAENHHPAAKTERRAVDLLTLSVPLALNSVEPTMKALDVIVQTVAASKGPAAPASPTAKSSTIEASNSTWLAGWFLRLTAHEASTKVQAACVLSALQTISSTVAPTLRNSGNGLTTGIFDGLTAAPLDADKLCLLVEKALVAQRMSLMPAIDTLLTDAADDIAEEFNGTATSASSASSTCVVTSRIRLSLHLDVLMPLVRSMLRHAAFAAAVRDYNKMTRLVEKLVSGFKHLVEGGGDGAQGVVPHLASSSGTSPSTQAGANIRYLERIGKELGRVVSLALLLGPILSTIINEAGTSRTLLGQDVVFVHSLVRSCRQLVQLGHIVTLRSTAGMFNEGVGAKRRRHEGIAMCCGADGSRLGNEERSDGYPARESLHHEQVATFFDVACPFAADDIVLAFRSCAMIISSLCPNGVVSPAVLEWMSPACRSAPWALASASEGSPELSLPVDGSKAPHDGRRTPLLPEFDDESDRGSSYRSTKASTAGALTSAGRLPWIANGLPPPMAAHIQGLYAEASAATSEHEHLVVWLVLAALSEVSPTLRATLCHGRLMVPPSALAQESGGSHDGAGESSGQVESSLPSALLTLTISADSICPPLGASASELHKLGHHIRCLVAAGAVRTLSEEEHKKLRQLRLSAYALSVRLYCRRVIFKEKPSIEFSSGGGASSSALRGEGGSASPTATAPHASQQVSMSAILRLGADLLKTSPMIAFVDAGPSTLQLMRALSEQPSETQQFLDSSDSYSNSVYCSEACFWTMPTSGRRPFSKWAGSSYRLHSLVPAAALSWGLMEATAKDMLRAASHVPQTTRDASIFRKVVGALQDGATPVPSAAWAHFRALWVDGGRLAPTDSPIVESVATSLVVALSEDVAVGLETALAQLDPGVSSQGGRSADPLNDSMSSATPGGDALRSNMSSHQLLRSRAPSMVGAPTRQPSPSRVGIAASVTVRTLLKSVMGHAMVMSSGAAPHGGAHATSGGGLPGDVNVGGGHDAAEAINDASVYRKAREANLEARAKWCLSQLDVIQQQRDTLEVENSRLTAMLETTAAENSEMDHESSKLREDLRNLRMELAFEKKRLQETNAGLLVTTKQLSDTRHRCTMLSAECSSAVGKSVQLEAEVRQLKNGVSTLRGQQQGESDHLVSIITKTQNQLDASQALNEEKQRKIEELEGKLQQLSGLSLMIRNLTAT